VTDDDPLQAANDVLLAAGLDPERYRVRLERLVHDGWGENATWACARGFVIASERRDAR
jgi:hypothetical protein